MNPRVKSVPGYLGVRLHQALSFSPFFTKLFPRGSGRVFFPGCSMASRSPELVERVYKWLLSQDPRTGIALSCCAHPTLGLGDKEGFAKLRGRLVKSLSECGTDEIIVCCPNCAKTLPDGFKVRMIWELLDEAGFSREIPAGPAYVLHDPCPTRSMPAVQQAFRNVIERCGVKWEEYPSCRERALCCGKAMMTAAIDPERGRLILERRIRESSIKNVLTYCFACGDSFRSAGLEAVHGLELLFPGKESAGSPWSNRIKAARMPWNKVKP